MRGGMCDWLIYELQVGWPSVDSVVQLNIVAAGFGGSLDSSGVARGAVGAVAPPHRMVSQKN
jgi:hypothetical protein